MENDYLSLNLLELFKKGKSHANLAGTRLATAGTDKCRQSLKKSYETTNFNNTNSNCFN
jgi:hypothetical protein